jgi:hypothetical protein
MLGHPETHQMKTTALGFSVLCCFSAAFLDSAPARAGQADASCAIIDVAVFNNRVHIQCKGVLKECKFKSGGCPAGQPPSAPSYLAVEANSPMAAHVVQIGIAAVIHKRSLDVVFDDSKGANPVGCNGDDCRRLIGVAIH